MDFFPRPTRPEQQMSFEVSDQYFTDRNSPFLASNLLKSVTILIVVEDPVKRAFYHYQVGTLILFLLVFLNTLVVCVACFCFSSVLVSEGMARPRGDSGGGNPHFSCSNPLTRDLICDLLIISLFFSIWNMWRAWNCLALMIWLCPRATLILPISEVSFWKLGIILNTLLAGWSITTPNR